MSSINEAHDRTDYQERFAWLDHISPVTDPELIAQLEALVIESLQSGASDLDLAPPEIVDWDRVSAFRFHFDRRTKYPVTHPDLRLGDYWRGLKSRNELETVDPAFLRRRHVYAVDASGDVVHQWAIWQCLTGELTLDEATYILDEGEFFLVANDFLKELNAAMGVVPEAAIGLPPAPKSMEEKIYNKRAVEAASDCLLLDRDTIRVSSSTTAIEVCDILTSHRQLIHVKRHLGSRDLSHLFAQGLVSATLLQEDAQFRLAVKNKVESRSGDQRFAFFDPAGLDTSDFEIVYAVIADWDGRDLAQALPFFSKINLRRTVQEVTNRGYRVSYCRIPFELN